MLQAWQYLIITAHVKVERERKRGVEIPGHNQGKVGMNRKPAMVHEIKWKAGFLAQIAQERFCRHVGGTEAWVHLHQNRHPSICSATYTT
jgi:hypothetical protein